MLEPKIHGKQARSGHQKDDRAAQEVMTLKQRSADDCDTILRQYKTFLGKVERHSRREFSAFEHTEKVLLLSYFHT